MNDDYDYLYVVFTLHKMGRKLCTQGTIHQFKEEAPARSTAALMYNQKGVRGAGWWVLRDGEIVDKVTYFSDAIDK